MTEGPYQAFNEFLVMLKNSDASDPLDEQKLCASVIA
jgi:hypothetical protein